MHQFCSAHSFSRYSLLHSFHMECLHSIYILDQTSVCFQDRQFWPRLHKKLKLKLYSNTQKNVLFKKREFTEKFFSIYCNGFYTELRKVVWVSCNNRVSSDRGGVLILMKRFKCPAVYHSGYQGSAGTATNPVIDRPYARRQTLHATNTIRWQTRYATNPIRQQTLYLRQTL